MTPPCTSYVNRQRVHITQTRRDARGACPRPPRVVVQRWLVVIRESGFPTTIRDSRFEVRYDALSCHHVLWLCGCTVGGGRLLCVRCLVRSVWWLWLCGCMM